MRPITIILAALTVSYLAATLAGSFIRVGTGGEPLPRRKWRVAALVAAVLAVFALSGCGGGGSPSDPVPVSSSVGPGGSIATCTANCTDPSTPAPTCAGQGYLGTFPDCICPEPYQTYTGADVSTNTAGTCVGNPPPPACPTGESLTGYGAQCCPTGDTGDGSQCFAPPPAQCPSGEYGTPPNCNPIPSCSAVVGGYWGGPAAGCVCPASTVGTYPDCTAPPTCPAGDWGTYPNCVPPETCNAVPGAYWGGNACECPAGQVGQYPTCVNPSSIVLTLTGPNLSPATVCDSSGPASCQGSVLSWSVASTYPDDSVLCYVNGAAGATQSPTSIGGYPPAQDGPVTVTVRCVDEWNVTTQASTTLTVVPPAAPPPDEFNVFANGDGTYTATWYSYGSQGCSVEQFNNAGTETTLTPGGGPSGSATTAALSPAYEPYTLTLYCCGVPDPAASPNGYTVSP